MALWAVSPPLWQPLPRRHRAFFLFSDSYNVRCGKPTNIGFWLRTYESAAPFFGVRNVMMALKSIKKYSGCRSIGNTAPTQSQL